MTSKFPFGHGARVMGICFAVLIILVGTIIIMRSDGFSRSSAPAMDVTINYRLEESAYLKPPQVAVRFDVKFRNKPSGEKRWIVWPNHFRWGKIPDVIRYSEPQRFNGDVQFRTIDCRKTNGKGELSIIEIGTTDLENSFTALFVEPGTTIDYEGLTIVAWEKLNEFSFFLVDEILVNGSVPLENAVWGDPVNKGEIAFDANQIPAGGAPSLIERGSEKGRVVVEEIKFINFGKSTEFKWRR